MTVEDAAKPIVVRGTEILQNDIRQRYREKIARVTLDSMVQFVGLLDAQGTVLEINKVALDAVGITLADVEGRPFWTTFWWQVSEEINTTLRKSIARAANGEFVRWDTPIYGRASGKETIIIDASLCPVVDDEGRVVFICAEGRDITEKKAQEREIAQKNIELQGLLERIKELDEIKTQFFANVSHELRTPLQLIIGPADRLSAQDAELLPEQRKEGARVIARNARMLLKHVNDLLDISKFEAGKLKIELQDTDLAALVRLTASYFDVLAAERGIRFEVETMAVIAAVDPEKIQRLVMNLLSNAFKFVPNGGRVRVKLVVTKNEAHIEVEDSGPGVKPEMRQAIFERFRQADGGTNRAVGGTGLGLAIAREFSELHKGELAVVDSALGGALFRLTMPLYRLSSEGEGVAPALDRVIVEGTLEELLPRQKRAEKRAVSALGSLPLVLVVEDNPEMNQFIVESLSGVCEVISAFDGAEGLARAVRSKPVLIVTDIMMPRVSGEEMIREIRKYPDLAEVPIILLTAKADEELKTRLLEEGAQDYIAKPFSERELVLRVRNMIELKRNQEVHRTLFSSMDEAFCIVEVRFDEEGRPVDYRFLETNEAFEKQTGRKDVKGRWVKDLSPAHEEFWFETYGRIALTGESARFEHCGESPGRWFEVYAFRVGAPSTRQVAIFFNDITTRKQNEATLREREAEVVAATRAKDEFLAMLGHELRNPLSPIVTALELMKLEGPVGSEVARNTIERQVKHLTRLVDDLMDVSRIARGTVQLKPETLELGEVLAKGIEMASPLLEQRSHRLNLAAQRGLVVDGDSTRLAQVIGNLLTNAAKYTPQGGEISVNAAVEGEEVVVRVKDNGIGIAQEMLPKVFDLFVQDRQAIDRSQGGLGIGLTIVRNLVERHGGKVEARSDGPGQGSEFIMRLPRRTAGTEKAKPAASPESTAGKVIREEAARVLVVDDNADGSTLLARVLAMGGHETRVAHDPPAALRIAAEFQPEIAVVDIGLPVMDGYALAAHLRRVPGLAKLGLIALTGYGQESDRRKSMAAGFHYHLVKPVDIDALVTVIGECLRARRRGARVYEVEGGGTTNGSA